MDGGRAVQGWRSLCSMNIDENAIRLVRAASRWPQWFRKYLRANTDGTSSHETKVTLLNTPRATKRPRTNDLATELLLFRMPSTMTTVGSRSVVSKLFENVCDW
ncbi:hypothetical protein OGAPHI_000973 [Ogataea philodendri]|uniref:Uncharacterized protein n=1 Tax=Ogataea philodendri TaxID=1378263 RepID=A0A9P8T8N3_9ASCO|nr:uncharacterized protein OGAPHI_000973 [Ogataea philodendri]KAH3670458.1 hypothetical protein OGAPHI_000973 [Ogataea philodendri]